MLSAQSLTDVDGDAVLYGLDDGAQEVSGRATAQRRAPSSFPQQAEPSQLTAVAGYVYFTTLGSDGWSALTVSDGTGANTKSWYSVNTNAGNAFGELTNVGGVLY